MKSVAPEVSSALLTCEQDFFRVAFCRDPEAIRARLDANFIEHGASGRVYTREEVVRSLSALPEDRHIDIEGFSVSRIADAVYLARYQSVRDGDRALRASLWECRNGGWVMLFHQGTPMPNKGAP